MITGISAKEAMADNICFQDDGGLRWKLAYTNTDFLYSATGTVYADYLGTWNVWGWWNSITGEGELHAINPNADNCQSGFADSFVYYFSDGQGYHDKKLGGDPVFTASGTWQNFCSGDDAGSGTFSLADCNHDQHLKPGNKTPSGVKQGMTNVRTDKKAFIIKVSPNPVSNSAVIQYTLSHQANVNITIYNYMKQPVKMLANEMKAAGTYTVSWNTRSSNGGTIVPGIYKIVAIVNGKSYVSTIQVVR